MIQLYRSHQFPFPAAFIEIKSINSIGLKETMKNSTYTEDKGETLYYKKHVTCIY